MCKFVFDEAPNNNLLYEISFKPLLKPFKRTHMSMCILISYLTRQFNYFKIHWWNTFETARNVMLPNRVCKTQSIPLLWCLLNEEIKCFAFISNQNKIIILMHLLFILKCTRYTRYFVLFFFFFCKLLKLFCYVIYWKIDKSLYSNNC